MITVTVIVPGPGHSPPSSALTLTGRDDRRSIQVAEATGIVVVSAGIMSGPPRRVAGVSGDGPRAMGLRSSRRQFRGEGVDNFDGQVTACEHGPVREDVRAHRLAGAVWL
jgi:hypothetical protein